MASAGPRRMDYIVYSLVFVLIAFVMAGSVYSSGGGGGGGCCGCGCCGQGDQDGDGDGGTEVNLPPDNDDESAPAQPPTHACTDLSKQTHVTMNYSITNNSNSYSYECSFSIKACKQQISVSRLYLTDGDQEYPLAPSASQSNVLLNTSSSYTGTASEVHHHYPQCIMELAAPSIDSITCTESGCTEN